MESLSAGTQRKLILSKIIPDLRVGPVEDRSRDGSSLPFVNTFSRGETLNALTGSNSARVGLIDRELSERPTFQSCDIVSMSPGLRESELRDQVLKGDRGLLDPEAPAVCRSDF